VKIGSFGTSLTVRLYRGEFLSLCKERGDFATDVLKASLAKRVPSPVFGNRFVRKQCKVDATHEVEPIPSLLGGVPSQYRCKVCQKYFN
jgi:hypothetical protein